MIWNSPFWAHSHPNHYNFTGRWQTLLRSWSSFCSIVNWSERHEFWSRFLLIHSPFLLPSYLRREEIRGRKRIIKVVVKINVFLTGWHNHTRHICTLMLFPLKKTLYMQSITQSSTLTNIEKVFLLNPKYIFYKEKHKNYEITSGHFFRVISNCSIAILDFSPLLPI